MALTRLNNLISDRNGRMIYVSPDDFNASDLISNNGNSPTKPFKTLQRAIIEVAKFSYVAGTGNDKYDQFTIVLAPGDYIIDNRPGLATVSGITALSDQSNYDITSATNDLYKYNSSTGGMVIPRGTSIVGMDLRKTRIRPRYVPDPQNATIAPSSIFKITGACYFWQFSVFDGLPLSDPSGQGGVYKNTTSTLYNPLFSHHKLTSFVYADKNDLDLFYEKVAKGLADVPDGTTELATRTQENRIVGPLSDIKTVQSILIQNTSATITLDSNHEFFAGQQVTVYGVPAGTYQTLNDTYYILSIPSQDSFTVSKADIGLLTPGQIPTNVLSNARVKAEIDTVDSSSPYIFNLSLRSTWGLNGVLADGSKVTGFKSMVIAQFTGVSLQKDDNAFIKFTEATTNPSFVFNNQADATALHQDSAGYTFYKKDWRHCHIKMINSSFIQSVSVFAVGYAEQHVCESGGDYSLTNSNSNFGAIALVADGFRSDAYTLDKQGYLTHVVPPKTVGTQETIIPYYAIDIQKSKTSADSTRLHLFNQKDPLVSPAFNVNDYRIGGRPNDKIFVNLVNPVNGVLTEFSAPISPNGVETQTITTISKNDISNPSASNLFTTLTTHNFETGTPLRFYSSNGYLPYGMEPARLYYCIRISNTQFKISPTEEDSRAGAGGIQTSITKIRSTIPLNATITVKAFVRDTTPDLTNFVVENIDTAAESFSVGSFNHGFSTGDRIFFRATAASGITLPQIQGSGALSTTSDYYVYIDQSDPNKATKFKIANSQANALNGIVINMSSGGSVNGVRVFKNSTKSPLRFDPVQDNWYLSVDGGAGNGIHPVLKNTSAVYANPLVTTTENAIFRRVDDDRSNNDRIYRLRYVIPKTIAVARPPQIGYVIKRKTNSSNVILAHENATNSNYDGASTTSTTNDFNRVYYIYRIDEIADHIPDEQDGIYYLTILLGDIKPKATIQFNATEDTFDYLRYSQDTARLYPELDKDNPVSNADASLSVADNLIQGSVYTDDDAKSVTREAITTFLSETGYAGLNLVSLTGKATSGREDRLIGFNSTNPTIEIELRRTSQIRAGNQTFEYTGFSSGNYSAAFPSVQARTLADKEILFSQSQKRNAGIVFYSGLNSYGDLYVGNQKINAVTGEVELVDKPILKVSGSSTVGTTVEYVPYVSGSDPKSVSIDGAIATGNKPDTSPPNSFGNKSKFNQGIQVARQLLATPSDTVNKAIITHDVVYRPKITALESSYDNFTFKQTILNSDNEIPSLVAVGSYYPGDKYYKPVISGGTRSESWVYTGTSTSIPTLAGNVTGWVQAGLLGTGHLTSIEDTYTGTFAGDYNVTGRFGINKTLPSGALHVGTGNVWFDNDVIIGENTRMKRLTVVSGVVITNAQVSDLFATTITWNAAASGTTINIGSSASGSTTTLRNRTLSLPNLEYLTTTSSGLINVFNTSITDLNLANSTPNVNAFRNATVVSVGSGVGTFAINNTTISGRNLVNLNSAMPNVSVFTSVSGIYLGSALAASHVTMNRNATVSGNLLVGGTTTFNGDVTFGGSVTVGGNLTVNGTTTTINSTTLSVDDKEIELGSLASGITDTTANGGGIRLRGATDKTIVWDSTNSNWTSSEHWNLVSGKEYKINNASVLSATTLGSNVVNSSLTSVGTIATGTWNATTISIAKGGTGQTTANAALNALLPSQSGKTGTGTSQWVLGTDGTNTSWVQAGVPTLDQVLAAGNSSSRAVTVGNLTCGTITSGAITSSGDITAFSSDIRLKINIKPLENALDKVSQLRGFTYNFNEIGEKLGFDPAITHVGVSAQEVQAVLPEAVAPAPADNNYLTVKYDKIVPLLIEAVKELSQEVKDLKARLGE